MRKAWELAEKIHADLHDEQCPCVWAIPRMTEAIEAYATAAVARERERASDYLRKICWSEEDIRAFIDWRGRRVSNPEGKDA